MRIFTAFLVLVATAILWLLPISTAAYDFKTDAREDTFTSPTAAGVSTANVTLIKEIYDDDTTTVDILSSLATDVPVVGVYTTATRVLNVTGLTTNTTRTLSITYDVYALTGGGSIDTIVSRLDFIWMLALICLPIAALAAIFTGRA